MRIMADEDFDELLKEVVESKEAEDILSIPGVYAVLAQRFADEVGERYADRLLQAREQSDRFMRGD